MMHYDIAFSHLLNIFKKVQRNISIGRAIDQLGGVFGDSPGDRVSAPCRVISKTQKIVLDASLLNTHYFKVSIKGKVKESRERSSTLP